MSLTPKTVENQVSRATQPLPLRIDPVAGYSPMIGRLVVVLTRARSTTLAAIEGLTVGELDHLHDAESNSIGALAAHIAAVERSYQLLTFEDRIMSPDENELVWAAAKLGDDARRLLRGFPVEHYVEALTAARHVTLEALAARDDDWLERTVSKAPRMNAHWAWFYV